MTFDSTTCSSNIATLNGGCVYYIETGTQTLTVLITLTTGGAGTSIWNSNSASSNGGIFYLSCPQAITVTVPSSTLSSNTAGSNGGGFYMVSPAVITGTFTSDTLSATASTSGGFIYVPSSVGCST